MINNGMHPFIELGFKPVNLLRTTDNMHVLQEREIIFDDSSEFAATMHAFMIHCVNRYGIEELEKWYFEQWGDPRITLGEKYGKFFKVFETAYETIKRVSPNTSVGGAGFGRLYSTLDFREIIELWKQNCQRPDFISLYGYPYMARSSVDSQNSDRIQDPKFINNHVLMMKEVLGKADFPVKELLVTEWSSSVSDWNSLNDSVYKGAFMLKTIVDNIGALDSMGYWLATDALTEYFDTGMLLHGGNGLLSVDGIKKPAFYAMQFASKLGNLMLGRSDNAVVTASERGNYSIVCHNFNSPNFRYYLKKEDEVEVQKQFLLFDEAENLILNFRIDNVRNGKYIVKLRALNEDHGSVQDEWREMDYSENLTQQDIQYLRQTSIPKIRIFEKKVDNNTLTIETKLRPHEIQSIHLIYQME